METCLPWQPEWNINNTFVILNSWQCCSFHGNEVAVNSLGSGWQRFLRRFPYMLWSRETHFNLSKEHDHCSSFSWSRFLVIRACLKYHLFCLHLQLFWKNEYPKRLIKGQKKIKIRSYEPRGKSYADIKLIHTMLTDTLRSIIGVNNHWKHVICFLKTFLDSWQKRVTKSP